VSYYLSTFKIMKNRATPYILLISSYCMLSFQLLMLLLRLSLILNISQVLLRVRLLLIIS
jgi:hypothetical protein